MFSAFSRSGFEKIIDQRNKPKKLTYVKEINEAAKNTSTEIPKEGVLTEDETVAYVVDNYSFSNDTFDVGFSQKKLQEAIIWSEILGKPVCKRRKRREPWQ
jgi:hypothetical protein